MPTTINVKKIMLEELRVFKSRPDIEMPNLQIAKSSIELMREIDINFTRNVMQELLKHVGFEKRIMPSMINDVLNKRLDLVYLDNLLPKPRDISSYGYKPRKRQKTIAQLNY